MEKITLQEYAKRLFGPEFNMPEPLSLQDIQQLAEEGDLTVWDYPEEEWHYAIVSAEENNMQLVEVQDTEFGPRLCELPK